MLICVHCVQRAAVWGTGLSKVKIIVFTMKNLGSGVKTYTKIKIDNYMP